MVYLSKSDFGLRFYWPLASS